MLVNMWSVNNSQINMSINKANGTFAFINGIAVDFKGIFAHKFKYGSPTSVSIP